MDRTGGFNVMSMFSKGASSPHDSSSPTQSQSQSSQQYQQTQQHVSPSQSYRDPPPSSPPRSLDSLFRNINQLAGSSETTPSASVNNPFRAQPTVQQTNNSAPGTPVSSVTAASASSGGSAGNNAPPDRQSAILSLLGSTVGSQGGPSAGVNPTTSTGLSSSNFAIPPHPPTPPGMEQRSRPMPSGNEVQGKILLEQLMSGNASSSGFGDSSQSSYPSTAPAQYAPATYGPFPAEAYQNQGPSYNQEPRDHSRAPQTQQQPPSPSRKSMFDFVSPFDVLSTTGSSTKKKTDLVSISAVESRDTEDSWTSVSIDPKRKSMENLMDQLARSQGPLSQSYSPEPRTPPNEPAHFSQKGPQTSYMGKTQQVPSSPPRSSPRPYPHHVQNQPRSGESPVQPPGGPGLMHGSAESSGRRRTGSPLARGKGLSDTKSHVLKTRPHINPPPQTQNITFDVSQGLESIQAPREYVRSTAIALVKVDPIFLPGSTIGATHWVAYAMTRGRVRVISRSSGDRTLLNLPPTFAPTAMVTDMAVYGNRLAGVTSDGGFIVWELPGVITDDVPGKVLVCIVPTNESEILHSVKWHPKDPETLAVASDSSIYLFNVLDAANAFGGNPFTLTELHRVAQVFTVSSPLISFDFDVPHQALATISEDSVLTLWNIPEKSSFWSSQIIGDGLPSSLTFLDGGVVIGRKNGTVFQLLPVMGDVILSTVKFVNRGQEDPEMFGHVTYDSRIQTLWVANSKRDSLIALKVCFETSTPSPGGEELIRGGYFEQVVEFVGPKPTLNFVILTGEADPTGEEANAACIAAKLPPGELALVAFSVHGTGVDQVLIRKEWYESAFLQTSDKLPPFNPTQVLPQTSDARHQQRPLAQATHAAPPQTLSQPIPSVPIRLRTPPSEVEAEHNKEEVTRDVKGKGSKGKNVGWKDKEDSSASGNSGKDKGKGKENSGDSVLNESQLGTALSKEIRKVEENLHTRIGRLIAKELDKQQQRLEEARANEQAADFARQEKILKLISTELTKNTTRVVETAVKGEVQNSVLPSLENITKTEVKLALNNHVTKGLGESIKQALSPELEKMLIKPDVANQVARTLSLALTPPIERHVKDVISKTLIPAYQAQSSAMHQELTREIHSEIVNLKKEVIAWQGDALRNQESMIRDMDQIIRSLSEQIKYLTMNMPTVSHGPPTSLASRGSPSSSSAQFVSAGQSPISQPHHRSGNLPPIGPNFPSSSFQQGPSLHSQWYSMSAPHSAQSAVSSMGPHPLVQQPPPKSEEWDDTYLAVLGTQDLKQLRELLARSNPEVIMPSSGTGPLSQAVILTLVHRLAAAIGETPPVEEAFKSSLWWLQRAAATLNTNDPLISPYTARVLPNVQQMLNTTKQRLSLLPGGPQLVDTTRMISDIQDVLSRKPL